MSTLYAKFIRVSNLHVLNTEKKRGFFGKPMKAKRGCVVGGGGRARQVEYIVLFLIVYLAVFSEVNSHIKISLVSLSVHKK